MATLFFPRIVSPNCKSQNGFDTLRLATVDSNKNRELIKLTTRRLTTDNLRSTTMTAPLVDVRQGLIFNNLTPFDDGVRVYDVRMGAERYAFDERQVSFENVFGIFVPQAWLAPRPPNLPGDPGDQIGFWPRVVNNFDGLGYTSGLDSNFDGSDYLTMPDAGVYAVRFLMEVDPLPFDTNFPASTFNLSFVVRFYSGAAPGPTAQLLHEFPVFVPAGTELLRTNVDTSISSALGNNSLRVSVGAPFTYVAIPDGNYPTLSSINLALALALIDTFGGTWTVNTDNTTLITLITSDTYPAWQLNPALPVASAASGNLAAILGYDGDLGTLTATDGALYGSLPADAPDVIQPPLYDVQTGFVCSLTPSAPLFVEIADVAMDPQISSTIPNNALAVSGDGGFTYSLVEVPSGTYITAEELNSALESALIDQFGGDWTVTTDLLGITTITVAAAFSIDTDYVGGEGLATIYGFSGGVLDAPLGTIDSGDSMQLPFGIWFPSNANIRISQIAAV